MWKNKLGTPLLFTLHSQSRSREPKNWVSGFDFGSVGLKKIFDVEKKLQRDERGDPKDVVVVSEGHLGLT